MKGKVHILCAIGSFAQPCVGCNLGNGEIPTKYALLIVPLKDILPITYSTRCSSIYSELTEYVTERNKRYNLIEYTTTVCQK